MRVSGHVEGLRLRAAVNRVRDGPVDLRRARPEGCRALLPLARHRTLRLLRSTEVTPYIAVFVPMFIGGCIGAYLYWRFW